MGLKTAQQIMDGAWTKVNEQTGGAAVRWPAAEGLMWFNNGMLEIVNQMPSANAKRATPTVASGSRQDFAGLGLTDGLQWLDVVCNVSSGGARGRPIRKAERAWLDDNLPGWHTATAAEATNWVHDPRDPKAIYLYPNPASGTKLEAIYAAVPTPVTNPASAWPMDDVYANACEAFILYSFYSKDATYTKNPQLASAYWTLFLQMVGSRGQNLAGMAGVGDRKANGGPQ